MKLKLNNLGETERERENKRETHSASIDPGKSNLRVIRKEK